MKNNTLLLGALLLAAAASASAHVPFLKPNQFHVEHGRFQVESAFTEFPFQADFAMDSPNFTLVGPSGTPQPLRPTARTKAAVYLEPQLTGEGSWRISTGVRPGPTYKAVETAAGKLYFSEDIKRVQGTPTALKYFSRADAYVFKGAPDYRPQPLKQGVEIIPLTSPHRLQAGQPLRLQVLEDGQPVPRARVVVVADNEHFRQHRVEDLYDVEQVRQSTLVANEQGEAVFTPAVAGLHYLFVTVHHKRSPALWESHNAALTLQADLPPAR